MRVLAIAALVLLSGCAQVVNNPPPQLDPRVYRAVAPYVGVVEEYTDDTWRTAGSCVIIGGRVITAAHVATPTDRRYRVRMSGAEVWGVTKVVLHPEVDVARLLVDGSVTTGLSLAPGNPEVGETVYNIGSPLDYEFSMSSGIVSQYTRFSRPSGSARYMGFTSFIAPGSSGSPVVTQDCRVVAIATNARVDWAGYYFGVPVEEFRDWTKTQ